MSARLSLAVAAALLAMAAARPALADPTAEDKAGARATATQANDAFAAKRYAEALDLFNRAESLVHAPTHVLMIARSEVLLGQLVKGREHYLALVHETLPPTASPAFKSAQVDAQTELAALEPRVPTVSVKPDDPAVKRLVITMDGNAIAPALVGVPHPVDPGVHVFKARGENVASDDKQLRVDEGAHLALTLPMKPSPGEMGAAENAPATGADGSAPAGGPPLRAIGIVGIGVGVAGLAIGGIMYGLGVSKRGEADTAYAACGGPSCPRGSTGFTKTTILDDDANKKETIGAIALIAGGAFAAGGVVLFLVAPRSSEAPKAGVRPWIGPGSAGLRGAF